MTQRQAPAGAKPAVLDPHADIDARWSRRQQILDAAKSRLARGMGWLGASLMTPRGLLQPGIRATLWNKGIAAQAAGFYASMLDPRGLAPVAPAYDTTGLDLRDASHQHFLREVFPRYQAEYRALSSSRPTDWLTRGGFFRDNDAFRNMDPLVYWAMLRHVRPARVVEIGSGFSTLLAGQAIRANGSGEVVAIDPYPREFIRRNDLGIRVVTEPAEHVGTDLLLSLQANDILFIDSSHVVRRGGDVAWLFFSILPRLADGVLVHVHDIYFPHDYPAHLITDRNVYWTEQYLLHAYLLRNTRDEVLFANHYAATCMPELCRSAFPDLPDPDGASFWFRAHAWRAEEGSPLARTMP